MWLPIFKKYTTLYVVIVFICLGLLPTFFSFENAEEQHSVEVKMAKFKQLFLILVGQLCFAQYSVCVQRGGGGKLNSSKDNCFFYTFSWPKWIKPFMSTISNIGSHKLKMLYLFHVWASRFSNLVAENKECCRIIGLDKSHYKWMAW